MKIVLMIGALLGFGTAALGLMSVRSDIQLIIAAVGLFSGFALLGLALIAERVEQIWKAVKQRAEGH